MTQGIPRSSAWSSRNFTARMISVVRELASFTAAMDAPGATPLLPAAMAATAVPWPDWSAEETSPAAISAPENTAPWRKPSGGVPSAHNEFQGASGTLDLETHQPIEVIEAPTSMNEAFLGSMKSMLLRNRGSFVTATFLIGTQGTTTWEGILHDVGNDHIIIFQPGRQRYIACDIYALKYIEFYDTRERDACAQLLRQSGLNSDMNRGMNNFY